MKKQLGQEAIRVGQRFRKALPLMAAMDVPRCLEEMKSLDPDRQREWAMRSRCPMRVALGLYQLHPEGIRLAFEPDAETHTVLCLVADLLDRLPEAATRHVPKVRDADPDRLDPTLALHMMHAALYRAESEQDRAMGWRPFD